ncbi:MAG TPA: hypothetical protein VEA19_08110 [Actinomycetota bacterium]|nr:hypothetical protein [Actinomycetota bacterium]
MTDCAPCQFGVGTLVAGVATGLVTAVVLRTRLSRGLVIALLAASGAAVAWGGLLLQEDPSGVERVVAVATLAVLFPVHARIVFGPFGRR